MNDDLAQRSRRDVPRRRGSGTRQTLSAEAIGTTTSPGRSRTSRVFPVAAAVCSMVVLAGVVAILGHHRRGASGAADPRLATCAQLPPRSTRDQHRMAVTLTAPRRARPGSAINTPVRITASEGSLALADATPTIYLLRDGVVVGMPGVTAGLAHSASITTVPVVLPATTHLRGCPDLSSPDQSPAAGRAPLPAGDYQLVAAIQDQSMTGNWSGKSYLSPPVTIHVHA